MIIDIIFLDVDGVLIPDTNAQRNSFDAQCVKQLRRILEDCPNTYVVFSTSKRLGFALFTLGWYWCHFDLPLERVVSRTPDSKSAHRGEEIEKWLKEAPRIIPKHTIRRYAVIDDEPGAIFEKITEQSVFFCDSCSGLTKSIADRVIQYFN